MENKTDESLNQIEQSISNTIETYNFIAKHYADEWVSKPDLEIVDFFITSLNKGDHILDIGCGPGHYSKIFHGKGFEVIGIDLSEGMLEQARTRVSQNIFQKMDMRALKFNNNSFDALWICASSPHIPKDFIFQALSEWKRVLKEDGILFINAIIGNAPYRLESSVEIDEKRQVPGRFFQWYPSEEEFVSILQKAGFSTFHIVSKIINSNVVKNASHRINYWANFYCRPENKDIGK